MTLPNPNFIPNPNPNPQSDLNPNGDTSSPNIVPWGPHGLGQKASLRHDSFHVAYVPSIRQTKHVRYASGKEKSIEGRKSEENWEWEG